MTQQMTMPPRAWAGLCALALVWGFSFLSMRVALDEIEPFNVVAHRVIWAAAVLWVVVWMRGAAVPRGPGVWIAFVVMGILNNVIPFSLIAWGQQHIETGLASIINASTAIWGVFLAALLLPDERLTARKATGVLIGFGGVATAVGIDALRHLDLRSLSQLAVMGATVSYALAGVWARRRLRGLAPEAAAAGMLTGACLFAVPIAIWAEGAVRFDVGARTWVALGYVSLGATALAYLLYYRVLALAGSGNLMLTTLLVAPVAILAGAAFRGEALHPSAYAGFALLALGLSVIDGRLWSARIKKPLGKAPPHG